MEKIIQAIMRQDVDPLLIQHPEILSLEEILPCVGFNQCSIWHDYDVWTHIVKSIAAAPYDKTIRLALLFHDIGKPFSCQVEENGTKHFHGHAAIGAMITENVLKRHFLDPSMAKDVVCLVRWHDTRVKDINNDFLKIEAAIGLIQFERLLQVRRADIVAQSVHECEPRLRKIDLLQQLVDETKRERAGS